MDRDAIKPNADKRSVEKLCLNTLWDKLAESQNRSQTVLISDPQDLYRFLATRGGEVVSLLFSSDSVVWASWRIIAGEQAPSLSQTNVVFAAIVVFGDRLHLYTHLDKLEEGAVYSETESIIFV